MGIAILGSAMALLAAPSPVPTAGPSTMSLWEAYSRGRVTITQVDVTWDQGGSEATAPLGYEIRNTGSADVRVGDFALLMSPNPREGSPGMTAQDGILTLSTVPANGVLTYMYGDYVAQGILPSPAWWCTEEYQYILANVRITLGGELIPFNMETLVQTLTTGPSGTQELVWKHLREEVTPVVGKMVDGAFWKEIPETAGQALFVQLRATNIAIKNTQDGTADPDAPNARVWDIAPAGYVVDASSITPAGYTLTTLGDGSTRISWSADLPAADVTFKGADYTPTPYTSRSFSYRMATPHITPGRVNLPRAQVSVGADFLAEAQSAQPVMDVLRVPMPPVVAAGGPYEGVEGDTISFAAVASDPNGDALQYRWDLNGDGTYDTDWSASPAASATYGDDVSGTVVVAVTDGEFTQTATAPLLVRNADPVIDGVRATAAGNLTLRVAGEKWHDVTLTVSQGGVSTSISVTRMPGSPDEQAATLEDVEFDVTEDVSITVTYTPEDDPVNGQPNGANPVWVIFNATGGGEVRLQHTFNVQHPETWTWTLDDIVPALISAGVVLRVDASDVGSDDLTFTVDWGDGSTSSETAYNGGGPDPYPSPDVNPTAATETFAASYGAPGTYTVTVTVTDDDGGSATTTLLLLLG